MVGISFKGNLENKKFVFLVMKRSSYLLEQSPELEIKHQRKWKTRKKERFWIIENQNFILFFKKNKKQVQATINYNYKDIWEINFEHNLL